MKLSTHCRGKARVAPRARAHARPAVVAFIGVYCLDCDPRQRVTVDVLESIRRSNSGPGFFKKEREDRSGNNRGDIDAAGDIEDIQP